MTKIQLPPYGKTLHAIQEQNLDLDDVYIFMGANGWKKANHFQTFRPTTMCLPSNHLNPFLFDWPVKNCEIMLFDTSYTDKLIIKNFVECLFSYGAKIILFVSTDFKLTIYKKGI